MIWFAMGAVLGALQAWERRHRFPGWLASPLEAVAVGAIAGGLAYGPVIWGAAHFIHGN